MRSILPAVLLAASAALAVQVPPPLCPPDDPIIKILKKESLQAVEFCRKFIKVPTVTATVIVTPTPANGNRVVLPSIPKYLKGFKKDAISSACSCINPPSKTRTATKTTKVPTATPTPSCPQIFTLVGAQESNFNPKNSPITLQLACPILDTTSYSIFANWKPIIGTEATASSITLPTGFNDDYVLLSIFAQTTSGKVFVQNFQLIFGAITMPVLIIDSTGSPVPGVSVQANLTTKTGFGQTGTTDDTGKVVFTNVPASPIGLVAKGPNNQLGVAGVAGTFNQVTIKLIPFNPPTSETPNFDFSNGTTGWTGSGTVSPHLEKRIDYDLVVGTNGQPGLQTSSATFKTYPFTKTVFIRYRFQTDEWPTYFGTQFNDYFVVTIRSDQGALAIATNSMNGLGAGAFSGGGGLTPWYTLTLKVPKTTKSVQYDVSVSNVGDSAFQSKVIVDKLGDLTCEDECGDCTDCPSKPMCQESCINPPAKTCSFYRTCVEESKECGAGGYAIPYGEKNCLKFQSNLGWFTVQGQNWIWATMSCLQYALIPAVTCDATCPSITTKAFDSHPLCYWKSGFCELPVEDYVAVVGTVWTDLFGAEAGSQVAITAGLCVGTVVGKIEAKIQDLVNGLVDGAVDFAVKQAEIAAYKLVKKLWESLLSKPPQAGGG